MSARTLAVSVERICYALGPITASVSAIAVYASPAGRATAVTARRQRTRACHRMAVRSVRVMAPASAASANANQPTMAAIRANIVTNAPHARAVVTSSRTASSVKCITRAS